jgi:hypothetical protein
MYSTCLFCHTQLGANEAIEHFPVGRRLAFDAAKGRLWVVCRKCERWNLTPIEERWEAIEQCERSYRGTKLRVSTDEIGLARISEGLELVRIGKPLRPEFAAWRYGDQFGKRRRQNIVRVSAVVLGAVAIPTIGPVLGLSLGIGGFQLAQLGHFAHDIYQQSRIVARLPALDGSLLIVRSKEVARTALLPPTRHEPWGLRITQPMRPFSVRWWRSANPDTTDFRGDNAMRVAGQILPHLNRKGASARVVADAVKLATKNDNPTTSFEAAARLANTERGWNEYRMGGLLAQMPSEIRLALEMMSHEETERRAMEGDLRILEEAWKEAEEIAAISDDMFVPEDVSKRLAEMKGR